MHRENQFYSWDLKSVVGTLLLNGKYKDHLGPDLWLQALMQHIGWVCVLVRCGQKIWDTDGWMDRQTNKGDFRSRIVLIFYAFHRDILRLCKLLHLYCAQTEVSIFFTCH